MKNALIALLGILTLALPSCTPNVQGTGNVEAIERQAPVTPDPNSIGDAINAGNAANYGNGSSRFGSGYPSRYHRGLGF